MRNYRSKPVKTYKKILIIVFVFFMLSACVIHIQLRKRIKEICSASGKQLAEMLIDEAVVEAYSRENELKNLVSINSNSENQVLSATTDSAAVNTLSAKLSQSINKKLSEPNTGIISIPLGSLSDFTVLSGKGPQLDVKISQVGSVNVEVKSEFESSGINQTIHRIYATVNVEVTAVMPTASVPVNVERRIVLSETVIVGETPQFYADVSK